MSLRRRRFCAVAAWGLLVLPASRVWARDFGSPDLAVWRVTDPASTALLGTAFMVDDRGFLLTAAHVVVNRQRVSVVTPDGDRHDADVVFSWCSKVEDTLCTKGTDAALLKTGASYPGQAKREDFWTLDLDFLARLPRTTQSARAWGFPGLETRPEAQSVQTDFTLEGPTANAPARWRTSGNIQRGMSGGPVVPTTGAAMVFAILSSRFETTPQGPATSALAEPTFAFGRQLADRVPVSPEVEGLIQRLSKGEIGQTGLQKQLTKLGVIDLIHLIRGAPRDGNRRLRIATALLQVLREVVRRAGLDEELRELGTTLQSRGNLQGFRDEGKALLWASMRVNAFGGSEDTQLAKEAAESYVHFLERAVVVRPDWVQRKVITETAADLGKAYVQAGQSDKAAEWFAVSYLSGPKPSATQYLAEHLSRRGDYQGGLALYCQAYAKGGRRSKAVRTGFSDLLRRAMSAGFVSDIEVGGASDIRDTCAHLVGHATFDVNDLITPEGRRVLDLASISLNK